MDAITLGAFNRQVEREKLEIHLQLAFPDDWQILLDTMDHFDRASCNKVSHLIRQMWSCGICQAEEVISLYHRCPAAFRGIGPREVIGQRAAEILPKLAKVLP